jgi:predicted phosphodiesterase
MSRKPFLSIEHAKVYSNLRAEGMKTLAAAKIIKREYGLYQTLGSIVRGLSDIARYQLDIPEVENTLPLELVLPYSDCIVMGDSHMPYIHKRALIDMLVRAKELGIKTLVLNGDTLDFDWCSYYAGMTGPSDIHSVKRHERVIYDIMHALCGVFDKIIIVKGNHDDRIMARLDQRLSISSVWKMFLCPDDDWTDRNGNKLPNLLNKCTITERFYAVMKGSPTGDWLFTHQKNYSQIVGRVASRLSAMKDINTCCGHQHHLGSVTSDSDKAHYAIDGGCMFDPSKIEYKNMRHTLHKKSIIGWVEIVGGEPHTRHWEKVYGRQ